MDYACALSQHPVTSQALGEVVGSVLEQIGDRPDLVLVTVTRPHAGALEDVVSTIDAVLHPLALIGCAAEGVVGPGAEVEELPAISLWAGRVGPLLSLELSAVQLADDSWHFDGLPERLGFTRPHSWYWPTRLRFRPQSSVRTSKRSDRGCRSSAATPREPRGRVGRDSCWATGSCRPVPPPS